MTTRLVVAVHDVAAATADASRRWLQLLDRAGIRTVLKVIPGPHLGRPLRDDPAVVADVADAVAAGHEVCLHGWSHHARPARGPVAEAGRLVARGGEEFWRLPEQDARRLIQTGLLELVELGIPPVGFTPPGWLGSAGTARAVAETGLAYRTDHLRVVEPSGHRLVRSPALCYRNGAGPSRRSGKVVQAAARWLGGRGGVVRLAVHPVDLRDQALVDTTLELVSDLRRAGARVVTFGDLATGAA